MYALRNSAGWVVLLTLTVVSAGCTWLQNMDAMQTERMLAAAGFQMKLADTPEKLAQVAAMPQRKIVPHQKGDATYYIYGDANHCRCIYVGSENAYQRYQKLALQQKIADEERQAAMMNEQASMDWHMWGPWGPWY